MGKKLNVQIFILWVIVLFLPLNGTIYHSIYGKVTDEETGQGISNVSVLITGRNTKSTLTDKDGEYAIHDLVAGVRYYISFSPSDPYCNVSPPEPIIFPQGKNIIFNKKLGRGGYISGRVLNAKGTPLTGIDVRAWALFGGSENGKTDEMGRYLFGKNGGICPKSGYFVEACYLTPDIANKFITDLTVTKGNETKVPDIIFDPDDITGIEGIITSAIDGKPIKKAHIYLKNEQLKKTVKTQVSLAYVESDDKGTFSIKNVLPGSYYLFISPPKNDMDVGQWERLCKKVNILVIKGQSRKIEIKLNVASDID